MVTSTPSITAGAALASALALAALLRIRWLHKTLRDTELELIHARKLRQDERSGRTPPSGSCGKYTRRTVLLPRSRTTPSADRIGQLANSNRALSSAEALHGRECSCRRPAHSSRWMPASYSQRRRSMASRALATCGWFTNSTRIRTRQSTSRCARACIRPVSAASGLASLQRGRRTGPTRLASRSRGYCPSRMATRCSLAARI